MTHHNGVNGSLSRIYFKNAFIIDGTGNDPVRGGLLVEGERHQASRAFSRRASRRRDGR